MKWKLLFCSALLMLLAGCGAKFYAEETSVELYRPDGQMFGKVFSNKGYDQFDCTVKVKKDGTQEFHWTAQKVNSATVAKEVAEGNKVMAGALNNAMGVISAVPIK